MKDDSIKKEEIVIDQLEKVNGGTSPAGIKKDDDVIQVKPPFQHLDNKAMGGVSQPSGNDNLL